MEIRILSLKNTSVTEILEWLTKHSSSLISTAKWLIQKSIEDEERIDCSDTTTDGINVASVWDMAEKTMIKIEEDCWENRICVSWRCKMGFIQFKRFSQNHSSRLMYRKFGPRKEWWGWNISLLAWFWNQKIKIIIKAVKSPRFKEY